MDHRRIVVVVLLSMMIAVSAPADEAKTTTRVFHIRHSTVAEASSAIQPLLSENGSLTVQPSKNRITVQDAPEIVDRVAEVLAKLDTAPGKYSVRVSLLKATNAATPPGDRVAVDRKIQQMFPSASFVSIGSTLIEGELKTPVSADIGSDHRIEFVAVPQGAPKNLPFGMPKMGARYTLRDFSLTQVRENENGEQTTVEIIHSDVSISPGQQTSIGAGASNESTSGLVLIIEAIPVEQPARAEVD